MELRACCLRVLHKQRFSFLSQASLAELPRSWFNVAITSTEDILKLQHATYPFLPAPFPCKTDDVVLRDREMLLGSRYANVLDGAGDEKENEGESDAMPPQKKQKLEPRPTWEERPVEYPFHEPLVFSDVPIAALQADPRVYVNLQKSGAGKTEAVAAAACSRYIVPLDMTTKGTTGHSGALLGLYADVNALAKALPTGPVLDAAVDRYIAAFACGALLLLAVFHHEHGKIAFGERRHEAFFRLVQQHPELLQIAYATVKIYTPAKLQLATLAQVTHLKQVCSAVVGCLYFVSCVVLVE